VGCGISLLITEEKHLTRCLTDIHLTMTEEMIEVEIKVPLSSDGLDGLQDKILKLGGTYLNHEIQQDTYYDHPCRSFRETDEAVRVRRRIPHTPEKLKTDSPLFELAYKGPKLDKKSKTRLELSLGISDVTIANAMLMELGFRNVATIVKKRVFFKYGTTTICIDDVEEVGSYMELEQLIPLRAELEPVRDELLDIVKALGIDSKNSIRKSYLELYLEQKNQ
jgi:adenylate cyclase class 2